MGPLVVIHKVAVGHVGQALAVAVAAALRRDDLVRDQVRQEAGAGGGRETHVRRLHRRRVQRKDLVAGALQSIAGWDASTFIPCSTWFIGPCQEI